ncbi:NAD(P)/FAD-dependent oxidoreductase [Hoeflea sp.]|uniref:NAD(P)/FAD-dependent oxidoreductase n=1 Tax=Hoeflea sp. TaxID=1940281 RepID=UPI003B02BDE8
MATHSHSRQDASPHVSSYYASRTAPRDRIESLSGMEEADVAVVGGGLAGLTTALELSARGLSVVLLEAQRIGWGASGRNGGFVSQGFAQNVDAIERRVGIERAKQLHALSVDGVRYVESTISNAGRKDIIGGRGWLHVIRHKRTQELRQWQQKLADQYDADLEFLDRAAVSGLLETGIYHAGVIDHRSFHIDPLAYTELVLELCVASGVRVHEGTRISDIGPSGTEYLVRSADGQVRAQNVVVATSAYGGPVRAVEQSVLPVATYVVVSRSYDANIGDVIRYRGCITDQRRAGDYYRILEDDHGLRLLWGGRITTRRSEPSQLVAMLHNDIAGVYPQLGDIEIEYGWSGLMGYARHKMPIVGEISPGLFVATAFGGHGLNTTAAAGLAVADAIAGSRDRMALFGNYGIAWGGGWLGRIATQAEYMRLRLADYIDEI